MSITKSCSIKDCDRKYYGRGYCNKHYQRWRDHGDPLYVKGHGLTDTPEFRTWDNVKSRCYNKNHKSYPYYGGRGITVCPEWLHDFKAFYDYVGKKPTPKHSLDRIDNDRDYEPGNVRWATLHEQAANRRNNNKVVGVWWFKPMKKWTAQISVNKKRHFLGYFARYKDAVKARKQAELKYLPLKAIEI